MKRCAYYTGFDYSKATVTAFPGRLGLGQQDTDPLIHSEIGRDMTTSQRGVSGEGSHRLFFWKGS